MSPFYILGNKYRADRVFVNENAMLHQLKNRKCIIKLIESLGTTFNTICLHPALHIYKHAPWMNTGSSIFLSATDRAVP
jgi:hypothetical protein